MPAVYIYIYICTHTYICIYIYMYALMHFHTNPRSPCLQAQNSQQVGLSFLADLLETARHRTLCGQRLSQSEVRRDGMSYTVNS